MAAVNPKIAFLAFFVLLSLFFTTTWLSKEDPRSNIIINEVRGVPGTRVETDTGKEVANLLPEVIDRVKKFIFFVGYARSGSSIIGTLMDAHPHVVISNEFNIFGHFPGLNDIQGSSWKDNLFNLIYNKSKEDAHGSRDSSDKGYKLKVDGLWQGRFDEWIEVLGDKCGEKTLHEYSLDQHNFIKNYEKLKQDIAIPIRIIRTMRNPFDVISTNLAVIVKNLTEFRNLKQAFTSGAKEAKGMQKINSPLHLKSRIDMFFRRSDQVQKIVTIFGRENVLDVHNSDLVGQPRATLARIFEFLEVATTAEYLDVCANKVFKSESKSRNMVAWTPQQIRLVETKMKEYEMLRRYSFTSD